MQKYRIVTSHLYGVTPCLNDMVEETEKSSQQIEISLPSSFLATRDKYVEEAQFASRNELIRTACRFYMQKHKLPFVAFPNRKKA